jgi:hypothetical protein
MGDGPRVGKGLIEGWNPQDEPKLVEVSEVVAAPHKEGDEDADRGEHRQTQTPELSVEGWDGRWGAESKQGHTLLLEIKTKGWLCVRLSESCY